MQMCSHTLGKRNRDNDKVHKASQMPTHLKLQGHIYVYIIVYTYV